ncbi:MAG: hypothetical protein HY301_17860 [Verrucomicrobia bacterium]|nr:hypothetical protein [Verrucomicrobiota bacterium]
MKNLQFISGLLAAAFFLAPGNLHARWLSAQTGRFQTMDSYEGEKEMPQSQHKYVFGHTDPVNKTDPSGFDVGFSVAGQVSVQDIHINSQSMGGSTVSLFANSVRASLVYRLGAYAVLGTSIAGNVSVVTDAILKTQPMSLDFQPAPILDEDDQLLGDLTVHRMGGKANLGLTTAEQGLNPPGFSVLIGGSPEEAAHQFRTAFPFTRMIALSKTVGSAKVSSIRAAGFDVVAKPGTLPNHGRLFHQSQTAAPFDDLGWRSVLSMVFSETYVP